jgi:hypothetical protein
MLRNIGDLRRELFLPDECDWNGRVREVTAELELHGMLVDEAEVLKELAAQLRNEAGISGMRGGLRDYRPI